VQRSESDSARGGHLAEGGLRGMLARSAHLEAVDLSQEVLITLPDAAFEGAMAMKKCALPDTLTTLRSRCLAGCKRLQMLVVLIPFGGSATGRSLAAKA
jgi:hypothetical protein